MHEHRHAIDNLYSAKRYDDAERLLIGLIESGEVDEWVFGKLARVYLKKGDKTRSIAASREAVKISPGSPDTHRTLAWSLHLLGDGTEARQEADLALALNPNDPENYNVLAWILAKAGNQAGCIKVSNQGLALAPRHSGLLNAKARALVDLREWQQAIEVLSGALAMDCNKYFTHAALGLCYFNIKDYPKAGEHLEQALSVNPHLHLAQNMYKEMQFRKTAFGRIFRLIFPKHVSPFPGSRHTPAQLRNQNDRSSGHISGIFNCLGHTDH